MSGFSVESLVSRLSDLLKAQFSHSLRIRFSQLRRYRSVKTVDYFVASSHNLLKLPEMELSLDLGCHKNPRNPFRARSCLGVDIAESGRDDVLQCDLFSAPIPLKGESVSCVTAYDFIEHIPRAIVDSNGTRFPFVDLMKDVYRVLLPGGVFLSYTPCYPFKEAFMDPTHVNIITEDTFPFYFSRHPVSGNPGYGFLYGFDTPFELVDQAWHGFRLITLLQKPWA